MRERDKGRAGSDGCRNGQTGAGKAVSMFHVIAPKQGVDSLLKDVGAGHRTPGLGLARHAAPGALGQAGWQHHPRLQGDLGRVPSAPTASVSEPVKLAKRLSTGAHCLLRRTTP